MAAHHELLLQLDRASPVPLSRQVYEQIRDAVLDGLLQPGDSLPPSRTLAEQIAVSRTVVLHAYEQLQAEGYIEMRRGSGTFISSTLSHVQRGGRPYRAPAGPVRRGKLAPRLTERAAALHDQAPNFLREGSEVLPYDFRHGVPAWDSAPMDRWQKLLAKACYQATPATLAYGTAKGSLALRGEIARMLRHSRGISATPEQIVITTGATQALDLLSRLLLQSGDGVVIEDPSHPAVRQIFGFSGATVLPVPVDQEGLCVEQIPDCHTALGCDGQVVCPPAAPIKLIYVTPSHQFPLGKTMSLARRLQLLERARELQCLVVEDDYDSEYRYVGSKLSALAGLGQTGQVVYVGTFSKVLFPALRIGYAVLPEDLVEPFLAIKWISDRMTPTIEQEALAEFIGGGHYARHVKLMTVRYNRRRTSLVDALRREFSGRVRFHGEEAGLHMLIELDSEVSEELLAERALRSGVRIYPASSYYIARKPERATFLLGYAALSEIQINTGIRLLAQVEQELRASLTSWASQRPA
ncbi:MAG TPA: PLP-dependent aminotransferase family protein [Roseiflexaceae bacterium]|nr:PLP-dependent aminotransferase family protein [Roseiflexaceae bacterium]